MIIARQSSVYKGIRKYVVTGVINHYSSLYLNTLEFTIRELLNFGTIQCPVTMHGITNSLLICNHTVRAAFF